MVKCILLFKKKMRKRERIHEVIDTSELIKSKHQKKFACFDLFFVFEKRASEKVNSITECKVILMFQR